MDKRKILIVDDFQIHHIIYERELKDHFIVLSAFICEQASDFLVKHFDLDVIAIDAYPLNFSVIVNLVVKIREVYKYKGPMIAISNHAECQKGLLAVGCDYECGKPLYKERIIEILNTHASPMQKQANR
ncbi:MAG: hypothetical protein AAB706_00455 [Patescibacteria group bacterium]